MAAKTQAAAAINATTNSPVSSSHWVVAAPPQLNASQAPKNTEKTAHPMSTIKRRRLLAMGWFSRLPDSTQIPSPACGAGRGALPPGFTHGDGDLFYLACPDHLDRLGRSDLDLAQPGVQILKVVGHRAVQAHHRVAL